MYSVSDDRPDEPHITEEEFFRGGILLPGEINMRFLHEPLKDYGILDETSFHVMRSVWGYRMGLLYLDRMHYLMYILGKRENGLQILFRCLRETQHRVPEHRRIGHYLESKGALNLVQHTFARKVKSTTSHLWVYYSPMFINQQYTNHDSLSFCQHTE